MTARATVAIIVSTGVFVAVAACAVSAPRGQGSPAGGPAGSATATTASAVAAPSSNGSGTSASCQAAEHLSVLAGRSPSPVCLTVGHGLRLDTPASPRQPWHSFTSSDPTVVTCQSTVDADGAAHATCTARRSGVAVVSTQTGAFSGDPHGPLQTSWQLSVTVTP